VTEDAQTSTGQPAVEDWQSAPSGPSAQQRVAAAGATAQERAVALANERPEVAAGAAFAGGLVLALILKRLAR
jgi:hypothetical protein